MATRKKKRFGRVMQVFRPHIAPPAPPSPPAPYPDPLADFLSADIVNNAGRVDAWPSTGTVSWTEDTSQVFYTRPIRVADMGGGNQGAQFTGAGSEKTVLLLDDSTFQETAVPWTFGLVVNNSRDEASPTTTRGYYLSSEGTGTSGGDTNTKMIFAEIANDTIMKSMGFWDTVADITDGGTGWHYATEDNYAAGLNRVSVTKGLQTLVFSCNPGVNRGSFLMRNGVVIGRFTVTTTKKANNRITLGAEYNADNTDQTYCRATIGDHALWSQTLDETEAAAWCAEKMTKFGITAWPPTATLPTWADVWYDASRSSDFVREHDRAITSAGNRINPATHVASQSVAGDKPFLQPCADGVSQRQGMVFASADNLTAHTIAALIDGTDDFTIAIVARASSTANSDGRIVRAVNSGGGSALITIENPVADPQTEPIVGVRHDGTNNNIIQGPSGDLDVHFWVLERTSGTMRLGRDSKYLSITPTLASITIDNFFIAGGTTVQEIFSIAIKGGGNATAQQLTDEHARATAYWGCRAQPATDEPWQYGASFLMQLNSSLSYHEDSGAPGTIDRVNNRGTVNFNLQQATDANNPTLVGAGTAGVYADFDGANDDMVGTGLSAIITASAWTVIGVIWIDGVDTVGANFETNDIVIGDASFWGAHLRDLTGGNFQLQVGQWDGARKVATSAITLGGWRTFIAWFDGANVNVEVQGIAGTPAASGNITTLTGTTKVGGHPTNTTQQFDGRMRALAVFPANIGASPRTELTAWANAIRDAT